MNVTLINAMGSGFADHIELDKEMTALEFFNIHVGQDPNDFSIRVNGERVEGSYLMQNGDRMVVVPRKIAGA